MSRFSYWVARDATIEEVRAALPGAVKAIDGQALVKTEKPPHRFAIAGFFTVDRTVLDARDVVAAVKAVPGLAAAELVVRPTFVNATKK